MNKIERVSAVLESRQPDRLPISFWYHFGPDAVSGPKAVNSKTATLTNFARNCLAAGADGIYLSVRDDWVDTAENGAGVYDRLVRDSDLKILSAAAGGTLNILHVCGTPLDFARFGSYP